MQRSYLLSTLVALSLYGQEPATNPASIGWSLDIQADWLYWKANETGLSYAMNQDMFRISNLVSLGAGDVANPKFDWQSGFRVGVGYTVPKDQWNISLLWTWNEGKGTDSQSSHNADMPTIFPVFIHPNVYNEESIVACMKASDHALIHLNLIDLDMGKNCMLSRWFSVNPHLGVRSAWINQIHNIEYQNLFDHTQEQVLKSYHTHMTNKFWGLGPQAGIGADFILGAGFHFIGDISLSLLYGVFDITHAEQCHLDDNSEGVIIAETNKFHGESLVTDVELGIRWQHLFCKNRIGLILQGGWEHHMFLSQNQLMRFVDGQNWANFAQNQGDVSFQGWTASLRFLF